MINTANPGQIAKPASNVIAVVSDDFTSPLRVKMLSEITQQLAVRGGMPLLLNSNSSLVHITERLRIDGVIYIGAAHDNILFAELAALPGVYLGGHHTDAIAVDDYAAGAEIGRLLLAQDFQRFGYLQSAGSSLPRMEGYTTSLQAAEKRLDAVLTATDDDRELAWQAMTAYLKKTRSSERIHALFCASDLLAFGAMQAIRDFGQGVHIGVVGFDDMQEARASTWHLTSWSQPLRLQVAEALNRLLDNRVEKNGAWRTGELQLRHSHLGKQKPGEMSQCGCAIRH